MSVGELCVRRMVAAPRITSVLDAAKMMREFHVGEVIVTDGARKPVGIVTDRDFVLEVVALELDINRLTIGDLITGELTTVQEDASLLEAVRTMRVSAVRRAPIVDEDGALMGIVSVDDLVELLAEELNELAKVIANGQQREAALRP